MVAYIPVMQRTLVADDKMKQNRTKQQQKQQKSHLNIWNQDLFLENSYKHQIRNYMQRVYLIPVQNKSSFAPVFSFMQIILIQRSLWFSFLDGSGTK